MPTPEDRARQTIDEALEGCGWVVQDLRDVNLAATRGVVVRNFPLATGHGFADYLLYIDGKAAGIIEAKKEGATLTGVEIKTAKYSEELQQLPAYVWPLVTAGLWPAQVQAITNLEQSLSEDRPRALIQMATGSGKTFTAINFIYRLIKFGGARRGNLGDKTLKEFQQYVSPYNNFKFTEEFIVQRLASNTSITPLESASAPSNACIPC